MTLNGPGTFTSIGYWFNDLAPNLYPRPQRLAGRWSPQRQRAVVHYLQRGAVFERYRGLSFCRFDCGISGRELGNCDLFDGRWVWPQGLAHYVAVHRVRLPEVFVSHVMRQPSFVGTITRPQQREGTVDDQLWRNWSGQRGATIALRQWMLPSWRQREVVAVQCKQRINDRHPLGQQKHTLILVHQKRRVGAFLLADKKIVMVNFDSLQLRTRIIAGWDAWNGA
jgi:hypothetical protein